MKKMKKLVSLLTTVAMATSMAFTVAQAEEDYSHIGFGNNQFGDLKSIYSKGETAELAILALDADGEETFFEDYENLVYSSSNENVVTVSAEGTMTARDYGVSTVTVKYGELSSSMMITVTPAEIGGATYDHATTSMARRGTGAQFNTVESLSNARDESSGAAIEGTLKASTVELYWPGQPKKSNMVSEAWFYDNGESENAEAGIGFKRHENYNNTGAVGVIRSTDTTYKISSVGGRWDEIWDSHITDAKVTETGIARTKGWHQVTMVQTNPAGNVMYSDGSGNAVSAVFEVYLDGQLVKTGTSTGYQKYIMYGYSGFTIGTTSWFDDVVNTNYMQVNGVTIGADENDGETLVASVDYLGYSGPSVAATYQWYYADSEDATEWTLIEGATEKSYKPEGIAAGSFIKAGVKVTETIDNVAYQTEEYFSDPTFIFDGTYESISLGKTESYTTKGGTITLKVTGFSKDGIERAIADISEMTFASSDEHVATVENGVVTAKDYGRTQITAKLGEMTAKMQITVTPKNLLTNSGSAVTTIARTGDSALTHTGAIGSFNSADAEYAADYKVNDLGLIWDPQNPPSNLAAETWFYDNGETVKSEAGIEFYQYYQAYGKNPGVLGVINADDITYKFSKVERRWNQTGVNATTNENGETVYRTVEGKDTGIKRTPGWHQVSIVNKNVNGDEFDGNSRTKVQEFTVYLDGEAVYTAANADGMLMSSMIRAYAGANGATAYFDDVSRNYYVALEDVTLSVAENGETLVATPVYYGPKDDNCYAEYKWYYADSEDSESWTEIEGATDESYTPDETTKGKFIKAGVKVTDTLDNMDDIETEERLSAATYVFDGKFNSISLSKSTSWLTAKGATTQLVLTGFGGDKLERSITDLTDVTFTSGDEQIATVSADGTVTAVDYGRTIVTAKMGDLEAAITITVTPKNIKVANFDSSATQMSRTGVGAMAVVGRITKDYKNGDNGAVYDVADNETLIWNTSFVGNGVNEAWFYDSGESENAEVGIAVMGWQNRSMMPYVGVVNSEDETYHYVQGDERWSNLPIDRVSNDYFNKDTGIKRTKGWHQVTFVAMNVENNSTSKNYEIYLDGQLIKTHTSSFSPMGIIIANAMGNEGNTVWVDDAAQHQYVELKDVIIEKDENGAMKASYNYYGPMSGNSAAYQWSVSDDGKIWTAVEGATEATFTGEKGKFYNVTVTVTDTIDSTTITTDRVSDAYLYVDTSISYADGKVTITAGEDISGVIIVAEYETVNGYKTLKSVKTIENVTASEGEVKEVETGVISGTVMLWESVNTQVPYCDAYEIK